MEPICRNCVSSKWLVFMILMRPSLAGFERPLTVEDELAVPVMDHLAPSPGRNLSPWERVEGVLVDVVATRTVVAGKRLKSLDCVEDVADFWAFGDAKTTGHGVTEERGNQRGGPGPLLRRVRHASNPSTDLCRHSALFQTSEYGLSIPTWVYLSPSTLILNLNVLPIWLALISVAYLTVSAYSSPSRV